MNAVGKAIWFIESRFSGELSLDEIADAASVSRYHLVRAFGLATGFSVMRYVRGRRLTQAAQSLANGAPDILSVALDAGYGSHEAFTRAFREQFGLTPEAVRARRHLADIELVEPLKMDETPLIDLRPARFENGRPLLIAGLAERCSWQTNMGIPALWQRFGPHIGQIAGQVGITTYGVCCNGDDEGNFDYVAGVEVSDFSGVPPEFTRVRIAAQRYAVFIHHEHISAIRRTINSIWSGWLPQSGYEVADAPNFERYGAGFDSRTGMGGLEIWIPVRG
jgi:AraC family transcriptional regulator